MFSDKDYIKMFDKVITIKKFGKNIDKSNHFFSNVSRNKDSSCLFNFKCMVNDTVACKLADKDISNGVDDSDKVSIMTDILEQLYCYYLIGIQNKVNISDNFSISDYCSKKCAELDSKVYSKYEIKYNFSTEKISSIKELDSLFESIINLKFEKLEVLIYYNEMLSDDEYRQQRLESIDRMWGELLDFCETKEELKYIANKAMEISTN